MKHAILRTIVFGFLTVLLCATGRPTAGSSPPARCTQHAVLNDYERRGFISAAMGDRTTFSVELLAAEDCAGAVRRALPALAAEIRFSDDKVGYFRVDVSKEHLLALLDIPGLAEALLYTPRYHYYYDDPSLAPGAIRRPEPVPTIALPYPTVATSLPKDGPYFAAAEAGLTAFWKEHPDADGRGERIALMDQGVDLLHPALQLGRAANGTLVPKVADFSVVTSPSEDAGWVQFGDPIATKGATFSAAGRDWKAPFDGTFRFGIFSKHVVLVGSPGVPPDPLDKSISLSVGVLWHEPSGRAWVDTDGDGDFSDNRALTDYALNHAIDWFGSRAAGEDNRIPFAAKIDRSRHAAFLTIAHGPHGVLAAGPAAANRLSGGLYDGAAPSSQLVDVRQPPTEDENLASWLGAFARRDVDVVNRSGRLAVAQDIGGVDFPRHVLERAVLAYDKPFACYCNAVNMLYVLDYQNPAMLRRNRQIPPPYAETINGGLVDTAAPFPPDGLVNTILAPSASIILASRYMPFTIPDKSGRERVAGFTDVFEPSAPAGYAIGANPSPTIPVVSGILADLIGAAKRDRVRYNAVRLTQALFLSAVPVRGFSASRQGFGLVNAAAAWHQLVSMAAVDDPKSRTLTSFSAQRIIDGRLSDIQGFHIEAWRSNAISRGVVFITRHGGYSAGRRYRLALRGDAGVVKLIDRDAVFVEGRPARVRFEANVAPDYHVTFIAVVDAKSGTVMYEVPISTRAAWIPQSAAQGIEDYRSAIPPRRLERHYVYVGSDVQALRFVMKIPDVGPWRISARGMPGLRVDRVNDASGETPPTTADAAHHVGPLQTFASLVPNSESGLRQITWENRGRPEYETQYDPPAPDVPITASLRVTKYAVAFTPGADLRTVRATNKLAEIEGKVELYDAQLAVSDLAGSDAHAMAVERRTLAAGVSQWRVKISRSPGETSPADVFVLNCTKSGDCPVVAQQSLSAGDATLAVDDPGPGEWRIVVRARNATHREQTYRLQEALLTPAAASVAQPVAKHAAGESWTVDLPPPDGTARYAAFRIAGTPGSKPDDSLRIAVTSLDGKGP